jgi:amino acid permease
MRSGQIYNVIGHHDDDSRYPHGRGDDEKDIIRSQNKSVDVHAMHQASWASCVVNLSSTILGAGILGVPYAISLMGWVPGMLVLFFSAICSFFGLHLMAECALQLPAASSFYAVAKLTIPEFAVLVDILVTVKGFGTVTAYVLVIADSLTLAFQSSPWPILRSRFWVISLSYLIIGPLSYFPSLDSLRFSSALSVVMMFVLTMMIVLYALHFRHSIFDPCPVASVACSGEQEDVTENSFAVFRAFPIMLFGFTCQQNAFTVVNELKNPTRMRLNTIFLTSITGSWAISMVVGICGYATFGKLTNSDILRNYPENVLTSACRVLMAIVVMCHYPLQVHPSRRTALSLWQKFRPVESLLPPSVVTPAVSPTSPASSGNTTGTNLPSETVLRSNEASSNSESTIIQRRFIIYTTFFNLVVYCISISVQDLGVVLSLMGATMSCFVILLLPGIFYYRLAKQLQPDPISHQRLPSMSSSSSSTYNQQAPSYIPVSLMMRPTNVQSSWWQQLDILLNNIESFFRSWVHFNPRDSTRNHVVEMVQHETSPFHDDDEQRQVHDSNIDDSVSVSFQDTSYVEEDPAIPSIVQDRNKNETVSSHRVSDGVMPGIRWKQYAALFFFMFGVVVLVISLTSILFLSSSSAASAH